VAIVTGAVLWMMKRKKKTRTEPVESELKESQLIDSKMLDTVQRVENIKIGEKIGEGNSLNSFLFFFFYHSLQQSIRFLQKKRKLW
jgi:hypothetical protein